MQVLKRIESYLDRHIRERTCKYNRPKISAFCFNIFAGISEAWAAFLRFNLLVSITTTSTETLQKLRICLSFLFLMAKMLECFLYLIIVFEIVFVFNSFQLFLTGDVARRRISFTEFLNFQVFNCTREKFVQNVCVFFIFRKYFIQPIKFP